MDIGIINALFEIWQKSPFFCCLVLTWFALESGLPFFNKAKSNGVPQLIGNVLKSVVGIKWKNKS